MSESTGTNGPRRAPRPARILLGGLKVVLPLAVAAAALVTYRSMMATAPQATRNPPQRQARLVEVVPAKLFRDRIRINARGVVKPAFDVTLSPQVAGEVIELSEDLVPGGRFSEGDVLLRLDPRDYNYAVQERESEVTRARAGLTLEEGNQDVALREYELLGQELSDADKVLVFRQPQLETARGDLAAAEAMLRDARLDLERTSVVAPFDALVTTEYVDLGSSLSTQSTIARLVGTDTFWVELHIAQADLRWVILPTETTEGSQVTLRYPGVWAHNEFRTGRVIRLLPELSEKGSMARLLMAVDDPLALKPENSDLPPLLIGQSLASEVTGKTIDGAIRVAREFVRDGDRIWIMNEAGKLEIRALEILYREKDFFITTSGVEEGERIVATDMATATEGMPLRTETGGPPMDKPKTQAADPGADS